MSNTPPAAQRLIQKTKINQRLPRIHYWRRIIKEIKNKEVINFWNCFTTRNVTICNTYRQEKNHITRYTSRVYVGDAFPGIYLTQRELECVLLLQRKFTYRGIGLQLGLSKRTIEYYFETIKKKLSCRSKKQLFQTITQPTIMKNII